MSAKTCNNCSAVLLEEHEFCSECGQKCKELKKNNTECSNCGNVVLEGQIFCSSCGIKNEPKPLVIFCPNCGVEQQENARFCSSSKYCDQCAHQQESLNRKDEISVQAEKTPIEIPEKTKKTNLSGFKKIIRNGIFSLCGFFILLVAVFGINGSGIPTVVDIYKYEKFKNDFFKKLLTVNSIEGLEVTYNGDKIEYWERNGNVNVFPLPTRDLVRNLKNLSTKDDIIISEHSCVNIHYPILFGSANDNLLSQVCYNETSSYDDLAMVFESPESLLIEGFGPVKMTLRLYHRGLHDNEFLGMLTIGYHIVDNYWLGAEPENPKETVYTEITVEVMITNE